MSKKRFPMSLDLAKVICTGSKNNALSGDDLRSQVVLGRFPQPVLSALSIPDLDVVTSVSVLAKVSKKHNLGLGVISDLHGMICAPEAVYRSATRSDSVAIVTMIMIDDDPLIAAIAIDMPDAYLKPNMHWLTSAYGKENHEKLEDWEAEGLLLWRP
jgi:hypothetical protein